MHYRKILSSLTYLTEIPRGCTIMKEKKETNETTNKPHELAEVVALYNECVHDPQSSSLQSDNIIIFSVQYL